jgi:hypothetical protein
MRREPGHRAPVAIRASPARGSLIGDVRPRSMHILHRPGIVIALVLLCRSICLAQSNEVYSFFTSASTPLTGYQVAVVSASPIWVVGSAQNRFGIEGCSYWTDSAGRAIPWAASRVKQPGDTQHRYTRFRLGKFSISIPLPPINFAFLAGFVALASGWILITRSTRRRTQTNDAPVKV